MILTYFDHALIATVTALLLSVTSWFFWSANSKKRHARNLPPLKGRSSGFENARLLTTIEGAAGMFYANELCRDLEREVTKVGPIQLSSGVVFRMEMPFDGSYFLCSDYKVARVILEGDSARSITEAEKSAIVQQFDLFPGRHNMFSELTSDPYRHATRKFMAQAFSMRNLAYTFGVVHENLLCASRVLDEKVSQKKTVDLGEFMIRLTFDTIVQSAFGAKVSTILDEDPESVSEGAQYFRYQDTFLKIIAANLLNPLKRLMFWSKDHLDVAASRAFKAGFAERLLREYRNSHSAEYLQTDNSIMGHLLRNEYKDEEDRISDMMVFVSAGHETTSWSLVWLFLEVARHPEVKEKLLAELDEAIPARTTRSGSSPASETVSEPTPSTAGAPTEVTFPPISKLMSLPYLGMCIKEAVRLWPVAASGPRRVTTQDLECVTNTTAVDPTQPKVFIPKGATVQTNFFTMFRAGWIDRPDEFIPERWSPDSPQLSRLKEMHIPFSLGRRNCIGQNLANVELTMIAAYLLRYYDFRLVSEPKLELFLSFKAQNVLMEVSHRP